ncbi:MAG: NAD(P)H-hydrate dehydratase [Burkholderiaceae bacterium]|nr:MAG: NAD(P)H-hydrate dehydratase [Burkholderiaceae bacterium]
MRQSFTPTLSAYPWDSAQAPDRLAMADEWRAWEAHCHAAGFDQPVPQAGSPTPLPSQTPALMTLAVQALFQWSLAMAPHTRVWRVVAGHGHQAADGVGLALLLNAQGHDTEICLPRSKQAQSGPPILRQMLAAAGAAGIAIRHDACPPQDPADSRDTWIDALWGLGFRLSHGVPPTDQAWIRHWQDSRRQAQMQGGSRATLLSVDLPSGLCPDTGRAEQLQDGTPLVAPADATLSLVGPKPGLCTALGPEVRGDWWIAPLARPHLSSPARLLKPITSPPAWLRRTRTLAHKGWGGQVAVWAGTPDMSGATQLAARAALRAGAGRVYVVGQAELPALERMSDDGLMRAACPPTGSVEVIGCGGGASAARLLLARLSLAGPLVLDADGLNAVAGDDTLRDALAARGFESPTILTPHPLEAARLCRSTIDAVEQDRIGCALALAASLRSVVVLKGPGTVIADPSGRWSINGSGHAVLATAGSGDVLAGWIASCWAQARQGRQAEPTDTHWDEAHEAAAHAVLSHGTAAQRWAATHPHPSQTMLATDLLTPV